MQMPNRRPRRSKEQITELLQAFHASGMTQSAFARQHGLKQSFLSVLLKKARLQPEKLVPAGPAEADSGFAANGSNAVTFTGRPWRALTQSGPKSGSRPQNFTCCWEAWIFHMPKSETAGAGRNVEPCFLTRFQSGATLAAPWKLSSLNKSPRWCAKRWRASSRSGSNFSALGNNTFSSRFF
jgi:hypothetical protein